MGQRKKGRTCVLVILFWCAGGIVYAGLSDFDTSNSTVNLNEFRSGGPKKDGIPALNYPKLVSVDKAGFLNDADIIVGVVLEGKARAYPIGILNWHEIVNDKIDETPIAVTWCPLTKSAVTFHRHVNGQELEFGVSGMLYKSNVVMYDRNSDSLWSQLKTSGLTGKHANQPLSVIPTTISTWKNWKQQHPNTQVLTKNTGHWRNYGQDPYDSYHRRSTVMFDTGHTDRRLKPKQLVMGVIVNNQAKAYSMQYVQTLKKPLVDQIGTKEVQIIPKNGLDATVADKDGNIIPSVVAYWFAWSTFHQGTQVYQ